MVVGFATNYAISAYPHYSCELKSRSRKVFSIHRLQGTCEKSVVFSATPVSSSNKTEIFLKVAETGVAEKTTDFSQVPCKRCIENTFLERDFNSQL
jgi:hypothetical protein